MQTNKIMSNNVSPLKNLSQFKGQEKFGLTTGRDPRDISPIIDMTIPEQVTYKSPK